MAGYERDHTTNASLKLLAYDIETSQQFQVGQMQGWLDVWGLSRGVLASGDGVDGRARAPATAG